MDSLGEMDSLEEMDSLGEMDVLDENLSLFTLLSICGSNLWPFANFQATEHLFGTFTISGVNR